ncbi:MAG: putative transposase [Acidimicrobiales bacterium]
MGPATCLLEDDEGGLVAIWGMVTWCWRAGDVAGRRLAAVGLVAAKAASQGEVASAFGVDDATLRRWSRAWEAEGVAGLVPERKGPRRRSKVTEEVIEAVRAARAGGATLASIAEDMGLSVDSVRTALRCPPTPPPFPAEGDGDRDRDRGGELVALAEPAPRDLEREAAAAGLLEEAEPVICEGASLPLVGATLILPALAVTGLLEAAQAVYGAPRAAFYGLRSLFLTLVFASLVGECRAEGLTRIPPVAMGRLLGLDRGPEVKTIRRRMAALAWARRSDDVLMALARAHVGAHPGAMGILYVDGHVRAYHGGADLPRAHLARARIAMAATTDAWLADANGDAVLVWTSPPGTGLTGELKKAVEAVRDLLGPDARPTICFDRGGWSPAVFATLVEAGFDILTYRKGRMRPEPRSAFSPYRVADRFGHDQDYHLADRSVRLAYVRDKRRRHLAARQVTRLDPDSGHQTQIITTRRDLEPTGVAKAMFSRWREENLFRFMRPRGLDAMDSYAKIADDPARMVPNPAKATAARAVKAAKAGLGAAKTAVIDTALRAKTASNTPIDDAEAVLAEAKEAAAAIPAKVRLGDLRPGAARLDDERKRLHDAIRMATWNAEATLARALGPHYARAEDEAHSLLAEAFSTSADLQIVGDCLHVSLEPLSAPRRSRAIAALAAELTATETLYPGTDLRLVYRVKGY